MCVEVKHNNKFANTQGELKVLLNLDKLPLDSIYGEGFSQNKNETCLCPIDIEKAAEQAGKTAKRTETFDWEIE